MAAARAVVEFTHCSEEEVCSGVFGVVVANGSEMLLDDISFFPFLRGRHVVFYRHSSLSLWPLQASSHDEFPLRQGARQLLEKYAIMPQVQLS